MKRFMNKINEKKGFTLAELLIVVAIIAVLVAVAIPVFTAQLEKSRKATALANVRAAYAEASAAFLSATESGEVNGVTVTIGTGGAGTAAVSHVNIVTDLAVTDFPAGTAYAKALTKNNNATLTFSFAADGTVSLN